VVIGVGAVGARAARQILATEPEGLVIADRDRARADAAGTALGEAVEVAVDVAAAMASKPDVVVLATPAGDHAALAQAALEAGAHVVSTGDAVGDVRALLDLDAEARRRNLNVVAGAAFAPGLTCVLACHAAEGFDAVSEIHVAKVGTGGPACARAHHDALGADTVDWRDGAWEQRGGSGRELCWFPDPIGAVDCYRAALSDALLLVPAFASVERVTARVGATRRDRVTARLPMLRRPHPEGGPGAVRVEVRGRRGATRDNRVLGAMDRPAVAAGAVAGVAAEMAARRVFRRPGAGGLAELVEPVPFLNELARRGVRAAVFEGAEIG
jgi:saccharopine dehydrogenase-like NADP-dependent oxidoreductase